MQVIPNTPPLKELVARVRRGSQLLDKQMPGWRRLLYRALVEERKTFDMSDGSCCVLGTIEHYIGRLRGKRPALKGEIRRLNPTYSRGASRLGLVNDRAEECGFLAQGDTRHDVYKILDELWRGEIEAGV